MNYCKFHQTTTTTTAATTTTTTATTTTVTTTTTTTAIPSFHRSGGNELVWLIIWAEFGLSFQASQKMTSPSAIHSSLLCAILRSGLVTSNPCFALIMMKSYRFYG